MNAVTKWIDPNWRQFFKLHSSWVAMFWLAFYGLFSCVQILAYNEKLPIVTEHPLLFTMSFCVATVTWGIARVTNQPGTQL